MTETIADVLLQQFFDHAFNELHWSDFLENIRRCAADLTEQRKAGI